MTESTLEIRLHTRRDTRRLGYALASGLCAGDLLILEGDLGAGKTFLVRAIARAMGVPTSIQITSPTFELIHELPAPIPILHIDLYRLESDEQLFELGLDQGIGTDFVSLVEWGDRFSHLLVDQGLCIRITFSTRTGRIATISSRGRRGEELLEHLRSTF